MGRLRDLVTFDVLGQNLWATLLVWSWAFVPGYALLWLLGDRRLGFPGCVLLGLAYWPAALYLFGFSHGLDVAIALAILAALAVWRFRQGPPIGVHGGHRWAVGLLLIGCGAFGSLLLANYVPPGMDASMHATGARLIAVNQGVPRTYAPFAPEVAFSTINLGLPTLAAVAIRCGATVPAAMLGAEQFAFSGFVLACYLLLRLWARPTTAASLAVFAVWTSRNAQETVGWGGVPTIASVALGLLAVRLLIDILRSPTFRAGLPLGLVVAGLPLIHGVGAAVWLYAIGPVALVAGLASSRSAPWWLAWKPLVSGGTVAVIVLLAYILVGRTEVGANDLAWTRAWQAGYAPAGEGWGLLLTTPTNLVSTAGSAGVWPGIFAAAALLIWRRRLRSLIALAIVALLLCVLLVNSKFWFLPLSFLLYPERVVYWVTPLAAIPMAMAWREACAGPAPFDSPPGGFVHNSRAVGPGAASSWIPTNYLAACRRSGGMASSAVGGSTP